MIRAELIENAPCAANDRRLLGSLDIPPNFEMPKPSDKTNALAFCGAPSRILIEFMGNWGKFNVLRSVKGPLRSVTDGISTYLRFCKMTNNRPFPLSPGIIRKWSDT